MNIKNHVEIINFLKSTSDSYKENGNEIVIHCPYCDDALRPNAKSHGHLYISTKTPVFHCFRCDTSGHLGSLLKDLGFSNLSILNEFSSLKYSFQSEKSLIQTSKNISHSTFFENLYKITKNFANGDPNNYNLFLSYIYNRLGTYSDPLDYLIVPEMIRGKLCSSFFNYNGDFTTARIINAQTNYRYIRNKEISELYFFQKMDFDQYNTIVLTEGPFDLIKLFRFSEVFNKKETFFLSILGKNYGKIIKWLLQTQIPFGKFNISLIFDKDNKFYKQIFYFCKKIIQQINPQVTINGYMPLITNDVGEIPFINRVL